MDLAQTNENFNKGFQGTKWSNTIFKEYSFIEFKNEFIDDGMEVNNPIYISYGANFAVDRERIFSRNINYYKKILSSLDNIAPVEGHYLEILWDSIFILKID